jgi:hypothetical protein
MSLHNADTRPLWIVEYIRKEKLPWNSYNFIKKEPVVPKKFLLV